MTTCNRCVGFGRPGRLREAVPQNCDLVRKYGLAQLLNILPQDRNFVHEQLNGAKDLHDGLVLVGVDGPLLLLFVFSFLPGCEWGTSMATCML